MQKIKCGDRVQRDAERVQGRPAALDEDSKAETGHQVPLRVPQRAERHHDQEHGGHEGLHSCVINVRSSSSRPVPKKLYSCLISTVAESQRITKHAS